MDASDEDHLTSRNSVENDPIEAVLKTIQFRTIKDDEEVIEDEDLSSLCSNLDKIALRGGQLEGERVFICKSPKKLKLAMRHALHCRSPDPIPEHIFQNQYFMNNSCPTCSALTRTLSIGTVSTPSIQLHLPHTASSESFEKNEQKSATIDLRNLHNDANSLSANVSWKNQAPTGLFDQLLCSRALRNISKGSTVHEKRQFCVYIRNLAVTLKQWGITTSKLWPLNEVNGYEKAIQQKNLNIKCM